MRRHFPVLFALIALGCPEPSPPALDAMAEVKKYFSSKMPVGHWRYLLDVTRETVDSWTPISSATSRSTIGRSRSTP